MNEAELWVAYGATPDDPAVVGDLVAALSARGADIPLDLEERSIVLQRREQPGHPELVRAHVAVLQKQGKPVPPELEELSLRQILADDPDSAAHIMALVSLYRRTGQTVPPELEEKSLTIALAERPDDPELLRALAAVAQKLRQGAAPVSVRGVIVRSMRKPGRTLVIDAAALPASGLEQALQLALAARPDDIYLLAQLLRLLLDSGRIAPGMDSGAVIGQLPPYVQTNEAIIGALLLVEAQRTTGR